VAKQHNLVAFIMDYFPCVPTQRTEKYFSCTVLFPCHSKRTCCVVYINNVYVSVQEPRAVRCKRPSQMTEVFSQITVDSLFHGHACCYK